MQDEIQAEVQETEVAEGAGTEAVETGAGEPTQETGTAGDSGTLEGEALALDSEGNLVIGDDVFAGMEKEATESIPIITPDKTATEKSEYYSPEDMAKAFIENSIDVAKLPAQVKEYHAAIMAEHARRQEIQKLAQPPAQQQPKQIPPPPQQPPVKSAEDFKITPQNYREIRQGAKTLAAKYLKIDPSKLDEYNQEHQDAIAMAQRQITDKATEIHRANIENKYKQDMTAYQQHVQAWNMQQVQARKEAYNGILTEFKKNPNWAEIDSKFYPAWFEKQDKATQNAIQQVMAQGDVNKVKQIMGVVFKAYDAQKNRPGKITQKAKVPEMMSSSNSADFKENKGMADASKLEGMSDEERAEWFIQNKFI